MEEENVNDFTQSPIQQGAVSFSEGILPGLFSGMSQIAQGQANLRALEEKKKREIATIASEFDPEDVWEVDQEELMRLAEKKSDEFTKAAEAPGVDLDNLQYGALADVVRAGKKELTRATTKAQENQKGYNKVLEDYNLQLGKGNNAAFDTAHMKDWLDRFKAKGSIEERNAMLNNPQDSPYVRNYNELDLATFTKPGYSVDPTNGTRYIDEENWANKIFLYIKGQDGKGYYDKFKEDGETEEDFATRMGQRYAEDVQFNPTINYYRPPRPQRASGSSSSSKANYGFDASPVWDDKSANIWTDKSTKKNNKIVFNPKNVNVGLPKKSITLTNPKTGNSETMKYSIVDAYYGSDGEIYLDLDLYDTEGKPISDPSRENRVKYSDYEQIYDKYLGPNASIRKMMEDASTPTGQTKTATTTKSTTGKSSGQTTAKKKAPPINPN